jgi:hypothetical protein
MKCKGRPERAQANITRNVIGVEPDTDVVHSVTPRVTLPSNCEGHTEQLCGACDYMVLMLFPVEHTKAIDHTKVENQLVGNF